jgi:malonyl CoA-acyl carrier protein transacylase/acyl carrier protein
VRSELVLLAAETDELLRQRASATRALAASPGAPSLSALSQVASAQAVGERRLAVVVSSREELVSALGAALRGGEDARLSRSPAATVLVPRPRLAFVFPGQGGQWWAMGRELLREEPVLRRALEACAAVLDPLTGWPLMSVWSASETTSRIGEMDVAQTASFALQVGLAAVWRSWGVVPDGVVGHSMGEIAAAHVAGALSLEDAAAVIHHRSRLLKGVAGRGRTAAVELPMEEARLAIAGYEDRLSVAGSNAPSASVLSGSVDSLEEVLRELRARGVFCRELRVDVAAHSPQMDPLVPELEASIAGLAPRAAAVPIFSTVTAEPIRGGDLAPGYWGRNLREPFRFAETIDRLAADGFVRFVEIGPHPVLSHAIEQTLRHGAREGTVLPSLHRERTDRDVMLRSLGALFAAGHAVHWPPVAAPPLEEQPAEAGGAATPAAHRPLTTAERVRAIVAEVLFSKSGDLSDDAPLVDMGMDSVMGLSLIGKLEASFGVRLNTNELLLLGTIQGLARRLEGGATEGASTTVRLPIRTTHDARVDMVMFPGAGGTALMLAPWASANLIEDANVYAMHPPGHGSDRRKPIRRMNELVDLYLKSILPAERPLVLVGYSLGGLVAYAVAHALERMGFPPRAVVISHTLPPPIWREKMYSRDGQFEDMFGRLYEAWGVDAQSRATFLESARADFEVAESYDVPAAKLSALTCIISSAGDELAPARKLLGWDALCARAAHYPAKGNHWDFIEHASNRDLLRSVYTRACNVGKPWIWRDESASR